MTRINQQNIINPHVVRKDKNVNYKKGKQCKLQKDFNVIHSSKMNKRVSIS